MEERQKNKGKGKMGEAWEQGDYRPLCGILYVAMVISMVNFYFQKHEPNGLIYCGW